MKIIGILGIQGAIHEHETIVQNAAKNIAMDIDVRLVVLPEEIESVDGLILPGGESTAMILIGSKTGMLDAILERIKSGIPTFGTCAGAILLAKHVKRNEDSTEKPGAFPFLEIEILRNGYGRQKDSFSTELKINQLDSEFTGIFIRAPVISKTSDKVEIISQLAGNAILVRQGNVMASTFHPELTNDTRIHEMFLRLI